MARFVRAIILSILLLWALACSAAPVILTVTSDRITYAPGAKGTVSVTLRNTDPETVSGTLSVRMVEGIDSATCLFNEKVTIPAREAVTRAVPMAVGQGQWGRGIEARFVAGEINVSETHAFSVIVNPYQTALHGFGLPQSGSDGWDAETAAREAERIAAADLADYCNIYEAFAWAPCDFSKMTPDNDEPFFSGQTFYCAKRDSIRTLHDTLHKYGIHAITYGKACAAGEPGITYAFKHPEQFAVFAPAGLGHEALSVDVLDRMAENRYGRFGRDDITWQYWLSCWTQAGNQDAVNYGTDEIARSAKQLGWDGVRYDGHFSVPNNPAGAARMVRYAGDRLQKTIPGFALGYNCIGDQHNDPVVAMTDPELAAMSHNGGLVMSEVYRNYRGNVMTNIRHLQSVGDAVRMNGGYFLCISDLTTPWNTALMLAGGARPLGGSRTFNKFATRFSAFIFDPALRRLGKPGRILAPEGDPGFQWDSFIYEQRVSETRARLVLQLVNMSPHFEFRMPWGMKEKPPLAVNPPRDYVTFHLRLPAGYTAERAFVSDDYTDFTPQQATFTGKTLIVPRVAMWTMAVIELTVQPGTRPLAETCAIPIKGSPVTPEALEKLIAAGPAPNTAPSLQALTAAADFSTHQDGVDRKEFAGTDSPLALLRDGRPDIHYARGPMYLWNRPWEALMRLKDARVTTSSLDEGAIACNAALSPKNATCVSGFPDRFALANTDVLVIDNIPAGGFTQQQRHDVLDFVAGGGSLLVIGDWHGLSKGTWEGSFLEEALPVKVKQATYLLRLRDAEGRITSTPAYQKLLKKASPDFGPGPSIMWTSHLQVKAGAEVLLQTGGRPFLIAGQYGAGRVAVFAGSHSGTPEHPYWESDAWPAAMADVLAYLAEPVAATAKPGAELTAAREWITAGNWKKAASGETAQRLRLLLNAGQQGDALFVARFLLEQPKAVGQADGRALVLQLVPMIKAGAPWLALGEEFLPVAGLDDKENPEMLPDTALGKDGVLPATLLAALIAAIAVPDTDAQTFLGWEGLDTMARLWCIGLRKAGDAVPFLEELDAKLAREERALGTQQGPYSTCIQRPFVSYALLRCGKRDAGTCTDLCRGALKLPYYTWRQQWVLQSLIADAFYDHTEAHKMRIAAAARAVRELSFAEQVMPLLFTPEGVGMDDAGKAAAMQALQEVDCIKSVPLALGFLDRLSPEELKGFRGLAEGKSDILRQYIKWK